MVDFDTTVLQVDPGKIALGNTADDVLAQATDDPTGPACAASLSAFQSALVFRNIFTAIVAVLAFVTLIAISYCIFRLFDSSWDPTTTFAAIGAAASSGGALFLRRERSKSIKVLDEALANVGKYCGEPVKQKLE